jgi:flagellin
MGVRINSNIEAFTAQRNLGITALAFGKSVEKLSSGLRINRAADDAAGLSISEKLRAQVNGLNQASRNAQDGISMIQTAEGALNEVHSMLQRIRELAVQAANDTLSSNDRASINTELQQLNTEINGISTRTKFNGKSLLTGALATSVDSTSELAVGSVLTSGTNASISVTAIDVSGALSTSGSNRTYSFTASGASLTITDMDDTTRNQTLTLSATNAGTSQVINFTQLGVKITVTNSDTGNKSAAELAWDLTQAANDTVIMADATGSANYQIGSEASDTITVAFDRVDISASGLSGLNTALTDFNGTQSVANAQALITQADSAIDTVNTKRANLGAVQNRLEHTIANLGVASENLKASESRIRDVDLASEMVNFTKNQILQQAGTSILAQANQAPQAILQLLR